ncbi:MAG TPA: oxygenase MpaB family protein [Acidimicrobiales bacterium]
MARRLEDGDLDKLRQMGDEAADRVAGELREEHPELDEPDLVRLVLRDLATGERPVDPAVQRWMYEGPDLPAWADRDLIRLGQRFFGDWPLPVITALFCVSLPNAYAAEDGARVLTLTSDLATKNAARRIAETGQMIIDVMDMGRESPDALYPGGVGYETIRGVRLLHGVVRQTIQSPDVVPQTCDESVPVRWCHEWGVPINQEDLLGTLITFTVSVLDGLDRMGVPYEPDAAEAYVHTWCVIGELLGIRSDCLPFDRAEGTRLGDLIAARHHRPGPCGDQLMGVLLDQMETAMPLGLRKLPRTFVHHLLEPEVAACFQLPPPAWWRPLLDVAARVGRALGDVPGGRSLMRAPTEVLGRSMIRMLLDRALQGEGPPFRVEAAVADRLALGAAPWRRSLRTRRRRIRARRAHGSAQGSAPR